MDAVTRVRESLLDNVGQMTYPGKASFDPAAQRRFVPIHCRTEQGSVVVGDVELDVQGLIVFAPDWEQLLTRLDTTAGSAS
jgi:hypothetical protein